MRAFRRAVPALLLLGGMLAWVLSTDAAFEESAAEAFATAVDRYHQVSIEELGTRLADVTPAPAPAFCLSGSAGGIAVNLSTVSRDPESGIVGYQLRLKSQAGAILRDWPQGAVVDLPASTDVGATDVDLYRVVVTAPGDASTSSASTSSAKADASLTTQVIRQVRQELEEVMILLRRP